MRTICGFGKVNWIISKRHSLTLKKGVAFEGVLSIIFLQFWRFLLSLSLCRIFFGYSRRIFRNFLSTGKKMSVCLFAEADAYLEIQFLSTLGNRRGMCLGTVKIYAQYAFSQLSIRVWDCPNKQMCRQDTMLAKKPTASLLEGGR